MFDDPTKDCPCMRAACGGCEAANVPDPEEWLKALTAKPPFVYYPPIAAATITTAPIITAGTGTAWTVVSDTGWVDKHGNVVIKTSS